MPLIYHKINNSGNMNLVLFCNEFENDCRQKLKVLLHNPLKISSIDFNLHTHPLSYRESFSLKDLSHCQCNFLLFFKIVFLYCIFARLISWLSYYGTSCKKFTKMEPALFGSIVPESR